MPRQFRTSHASRERNRVHARKTRQRKKEQMQTLQGRADELKQEQVRLKQCINEKNTASILVGLFATSGEKDVSQQAEDPQVEQLLTRPAEEIPDATKVTELPALILPGQHNSRRGKVTEDSANEDTADDGIDYQLLGKDRSKCTPEELDKIRRERNRMHAKRTRDRKRLFMEEMSVLCEILASENELLRSHLRKLGGDCPPGPTSEQSEPKEATQEQLRDRSKNEVTMGQLMTLIEAAGSFESSKANSTKARMSLSSVACSVASAVSASDSNNSSASASIAEEQDDEAMPPLKRQRLSTDTGVSLVVPQSITAL